MHIGGKCRVGKSSKIHSTFLYGPHTYAKSTKINKGFEEKLA